MRKKDEYLNVKSTIVKTIFIVMLIFILISIGLTATLYAFYGQYIQGIVEPTNKIIFGVNTGILFSMFITLVFVGPIVFFASKKIANPLVEMRKVAKAMSEGDFSVRAKDYYSGELGQLAATLNKLAGELSNTINSLTIEGNLLKQIINSMSDGLLGFDLNQNINLRNSTFDNMFGIVSGLEELERSICEDIYKVSLVAAASSKTETATCDIKGKTILISASPILSEGEIVVGTVLLFRDITEATRLEQTRRDYVANVSHELRSPLTAVKGLIIPLKEGMVKVEDKRKHFYEVIYNEIERLNRLVNDLFELSRLQSRKEPFDIQVVDVLNILYDQQDKYQLLAEEKGINLNVEAKNQLLYAKGNIDRISQVLTILIDNALKFAKRNSNITLSAEIKNSKVRISVRNTGSTINSEDLQFVFDRFYKVDKSHKEEGAGLGLSIAKEIVTRMNGCIYAESDGINETCFSFALDEE